MENNTKKLWVLLLFCLLFFAVACSGGSTQENAGVATAVVKTKVPEPKLIVITFESGYELPLARGITEKLRSELTTGEVVYPIISFRETPDVELNQRLTTNGIQLGDVLAEATYLATMAPGAGEFLDTLEQEGLLKTALLFPAEAKVSNEFMQQLFAAAPDKPVFVEVRLFGIPSTVQRANIETLLNVRNESPGPVYLLDGEIAVQDIDELLTLPIVHSVTAPQLAEPGGL